MTDAEGATRTVTDLLAPEHDTVPPRDSGLPSHAYVVCSTQRSGSGLLCRGLAGTGLAATPTEYFNQVGRERLTTRWGCGPSLSSYVSALRARRTTHDGVFGTKLHWDQLQALRAEALGLGRAEPEFEVSARFLEDLLPVQAYIHILRRDVNLQAVSFWTALQTNLWSQPRGTRGGDPRDVPYSFVGIDRCRRLIENGELHWDRFFRFNRIQPLEVVYEELDTDYEATIARVLGRLVPGVDGVRIAPAPTRRLRDRRSHELAALFARDRESRGLDDPLAPPAPFGPPERESELARTLAAVTTSRSWRLTRPLRALGAASRRRGIRSPTDQSTPTT